MLTSALTEKLYAFMTLGGCVLHVECFEEHGKIFSYGFKLHLDQVRNKMTLMAIVVNRIKDEFTNCGLKSNCYCAHPKKLLKR
jgi:hypothetical protein